MKSAYLLISVLLFCSFRVPSVGVSVNGHLRSRSHKNVRGICVFVTGGLSGYGRTKTTTNKNGDFELVFNTGEDSDVSFYYVNSPKDTVLLKRIHNIPEFAELTL